MAKRSLIIRADANREMGTGHLMRCLALAQGWQRRGGHVTFVTRCPLPPLVQRLHSEGVAVVKLNAQPAEADWHILTELIERAPTTWVTLDGYHFTTAEQQRIKEAGGQLLVIDDLGHLSSYVADLILNQNLHAPFVAYSCDSATRLLLGPRYALLRREFNAHADSRSSEDGQRRLLVTLGGSDPVNQTQRVIAALGQLNLAQCPHGLQVRAVVGRHNPHLHALQREAEASPVQVELLTDVQDMAQQIAWADIAVSAGGSTCWELAYMGVPTVMVTIADNQRPIAEQLARLGVAVALGDWTQVTTDQIAEALQTLFAHRQTYDEMRTRGQQLVDGRGAARVVQVMMERAGESATQCGEEQFCIRRANLADAELLWRWANEPGVRQASFRSDPISWETHIAWFWRKLRDPCSDMYLFTDRAGVPIAQARFDLAPDHHGESIATISLSIDAKMRGRGLGSQVIKQACSHFWRQRSAIPIQAYIKPENTMSLRAFSAAGFSGFERTITYLGHPAVVGMLDAPAAAKPFRNTDT